MVNLKDKVEYKGYTFYKDGSIVSPKGRKIEGYFFTYPFSHVTLRYDGKNHKVLRAKLIYELFYEEEVSRKYIVRFKDGDTNNCAPSNLYLESRKHFSEENPHTNMRKYGKRTEANIRKSYYDEDGNKREDALSIRELAVKYGCSLATIQMILNEERYPKKKKA